jgi:hypothetical protein
MKTNTLIVTIEGGGMYPHLQFCQKTNGKRPCSDRFI